jgi:hypothetical protein
MKKTRKERYYEFQHTLDYFFCEVAGVDEDDYFKFSEVKSGIIFFLLKNEFNETSTCFLANSKSQIYKNLNDIVEKHRSLEKNAKILVEFMEDYYPDIKMEYGQMWLSGILSLNENKKEEN